MCSQVLASTSQAEVQVNGIIQSPLLVCRKPLLLHYGGQVAELLCPGLIILVRGLTEVYAASSRKHACRFLFGS